MATKVSLTIWFAFIILFVNSQPSSTTDEKYSRPHSFKNNQEEPVDELADTENIRNLALPNQSTGEETFNEKADLDVQAPDKFTLFVAFIGVFIVVPSLMIAIFCIFLLCFENLI